MNYPGQQVQVDVKVVPRKCIANPEQRSTYSSADFLKKLVKWYSRREIRVECVQTDNGFEFTNRFSNSKQDLPTLFEDTAAKLDIQHKLIRPYTPRHNGKVERSHRKGNEQFYARYACYETTQQGLLMITAEMPLVDGTA